MSLKEGVADARDPRKHAETKAREIADSLMRELGPIKGALGELAAHAQQFTEAVRRPKRVHRDPRSGKIMAVETGHGVYTVERDPKTGRATGFGEPQRMQ